MSGWTWTAGNRNVGECGSCDECVWMGTVVVISAVDKRISKKTNLLDSGWTQMTGESRWLVNVDPGKRGSYGECGWMRTVLLISAVD